MKRLKVVHRFLDMETSTFFENIDSFRVEEDGLIYFDDPDGHLFILNVHSGTYTIMKVVDKETPEQPVGLIH